MGHSQYSGIWSAEWVQDRGNLDGHMRRICSEMICNSWNKSWHRTPPCCSTVPLVSNRCPDPAERQQPTQSPALHSWEQTSTNGRSKGSNLLLKCMINDFFYLQGTCTRVGNTFWLETFEEILNWFQIILYTLWLHSQKSCHSNFKKYQCIWTTRGYS